jgi:CRP/FNR family transcriptional regulator, cyclic AMP receptor protein
LTGSARQSPTGKVLPDTAWIEGKLPAEEAAALRAAGRAVVWPRGAVLLREGEAGDRAILIERGRVKITVSSCTGSTILLAIRGPGELVGELSSLDGRARSATVTAMSAVSGVAISAGRFRRLLEANGRLSICVLASIVSRLRESDRRRAEFGGHDVRARISHVLVELAEQHGVEARDGSRSRTITITQQELAGAAGASRESVVRALHVLHVRGLVATSRGKVIVLDAEALGKSVHE